jgi:hypothetical protein
MSLLLPNVFVRVIFAPTLVNRSDLEALSLSRLVVCSFPPHTAQELVPDSCYFSVLSLRSIRAQQQAPSSDSLAGGTSFSSILTSLSGMFNLHYGRIDADSMTHPNLRDVLMERDGEQRGNDPYVPL